MTLLRVFGHCAVFVSMSLAVPVSAMAQTHLDVAENLAPESVTSSDRAESRDRLQISSISIFDAAQRHAARAGSCGADESDAPAGK